MANAGERSLAVPSVGTCSGDNGASTKPGADTGADTNALLIHSSETEASCGCCDCHPAPGSWRHVLGKAVASDWFGHGAMGVTLCTVVIMCMPYSSMSDEYAERLERSLTVITWLFIVEMSLKLVGLGCRGYWSDGWNKLDGSIVLTSIADMVVVTLLGDGVNLTFLRTLRVLRILRLLRLLRVWKGLYKIITTFIEAMPQMANIFILMFLILTIFALLGMQLFGGAYNPTTGYSDVPCPGSVCPDPEQDELPRYHFDYFVVSCSPRTDTTPLAHLRVAIHARLTCSQPALITCFIMMSGSWIDSAVPAVEALGLGAICFHVAVVLIGCYVIMNLFIAILLNQFATDTDADGNEPGNSHLEENEDTPTKAPEGSAMDDDEEPRTLQPWPHDYSLYCFSPHSSVRMACDQLLRRPAFDRVIILVIVLSSVALALDVPRLSPTSWLATSLHLLDYVWTIVFFGELFVKCIAYGFVCNGPKSYINSPWNMLDFFVVMISFLVLLASIFPALSGLKSLRVLRVLRPLRLLSRSEGMKIIITSLFKSLPSVSNVFGVVIAFQVVFAVLGMQLFMGSLAACTDPSIMLKAECHDASPPMPWLPPDVPTAVGRKSDTIHQVIYSPVPLHVQTAAATNTSDKREVQRRALEHMPSEARSKRSKRSTNNHNRRLKGGGGGISADSGATRWITPELGSFDSFGSAMLLLYIMSTGDGWDMMMFATMDARGPSEAPLRNDFSVAALFSIVWMFVGSFFSLNLFVGVIVDNFNRISAMGDVSFCRTDFPSSSKLHAGSIGVALPAPGRVPLGNAMRVALCIAGLCNNVCRAAAVGRDNQERGPR